LQNPGRFAVACGAALQGLGEAAIEINLLPDEERLWQRAVRWLSQRRARSAWGLDLGSSGLKAVKLTRGEGPSDRIILTACDIVEHDKILSQAASESQQRSLIEASVGVFFAKNDCTADRICLSLPPRSVWVRQLEMPALEPAKLDSAMQYAGIGAFPIALADLEWRYAILDDTQTFSEPPGKVQVAIFGANRIVLKGWLATMRSMGLRIDVVQNDCLALHNFVSYAYFPPAAEEPSGEVSSEAPLVILDVGADATNFIVSGPDWTWFRTAGLGVDRASTALVRQFRIPFARAEQWKRSPASATNTAMFFETIQPVFEDIFQETKTELETFEQTYPQRPVQRILALGGGLRLHGLFRYLWLRK
jgi:Tfp pilus assembly PilM family ATPase